MIFHFIKKKNPVLLPVYNDVSNFKNNEKKERANFVNFIQIHENFQTKRIRCKTCNSLQAQKTHLRIISGLFDLFIFNIYTTKNT